MFRFDLIAELAASIESEHIFDIFFSYLLDISVRTLANHTNRIKNEYEENDRGPNAKHNKILY